MKDIVEFTSTLERVPPVPCSFKVGDKVTFTNPAGIKFSGHKVIGFSTVEDMFHGRFIHLDYDCFWFPAKPESLEIES